MKCKCGHDRYPEHTISTAVCSKCKCEKFKVDDNPSNRELKNRIAKKIE